MFFSLKKEENDPQLTKKSTIMGNHRVKVREIAEVVRISSQKVFTVSYMDI